MSKETTRLSNEKLRDTAQCRHCFATYPRDNLDWTRKTRVKIGTDDSWGTWNVYSYFLKCDACGKLAVGDETVEYGK